METKIYAFHASGYKGQLVEVEVDIRKGLPAFDLVGLAGTAVKEARERVKTAILRSGFEFPLGRILVNLCPAGLPKHGTNYDLAICAAILAASGEIRLPQKEILVLGELRLSGELEPVKGFFNALLSALDHGIEEVILPHTHCAFIEEFNNLSMNAIGRLSELKSKLRPFVFAEGETHLNLGSEPLDRISSQNFLKYALMIAVAGRHHSLFFGPPGVGKSLAMQTLPSLWPELSFRQALEIAELTSLDELEFRGLDRRAPFRNPHHTTSVQAMLGGGKPLSPGEISLAHNGMLVLDEAPEFQIRVLQGLREPLEAHKILLARAHDHAEFPAKTTVFLTMNPCPCGNLGKEGGFCACGNLEIAGYWKRIGAPLLDRMDIRLGVYGRDDSGLDLLVHEKALERIALAEKIQDKKWGKLKRNSSIQDLRVLKTLLNFELPVYFHTQNFRSQTALLRLALTWAMCEGREEISQSDLEWAIRLRSMEPELAGIPVCK